MPQGTSEEAKQVVAAWREKISAAKTISGVGDAKTGRPTDRMEFRLAKPDLYSIKSPGYEMYSDGSKIVFFGDYLEIEAPSKLTQTFSFDQLPPGAHSIDATTLTEKDGKTIYTAVSTLPDVESRDGMIASGMEVGIVEGFERLDQMLEDWKALA